MSNLIWTSDYTGTPDSGDAEAALFAVEAANANRETPLPTTPAAALKASYLTLMAEAVSNLHLDYANQAAVNALNLAQATERWHISSPTQRSNAVDELEPLP